MPSKTLTPEQEQVVHHPLGYHARVLAVAGSGKSTTMAHRIQHLVQSCQVHPNHIQVLMFNALARKQFNVTLEKIGMADSRMPVVHTFHSFSFQIINEAAKRGILPANQQYWLADKSELIWLTVKRAINDLEKARQIPPESVDPEEALNTIGLWKGSLIPPDRAGSYASPYLPLVYKQFEYLRNAESALTFDDFIPLANDLLENNAVLYERYCRDLQHLIVDEYQDINFGQQRLIEILASEKVDIMVVGDDDQTIYEWRGARPNYIIHDFATVFNAQPVLDYRLSRSFRFGPVIAQCAANVIACNTNRVDKPLVAFQAGKPGFIQVYEGGFDAVKELAQQVLALVQVDHVPPSEIIVLARLFAQLDNLEAEFLARGIPYKVDGQEPFYKRREINTLLDYIRLAREYWDPITDSSGNLLQSIANKPSRMLSRSLVNKLVFTGKQRRYSPQKLLEAATRDASLGVARWQSDRVIELWNFLEGLSSRLQQPYKDAGELLSWMVKELDYLSYFQDYYGKGENSDEKAYAVVNFIRYVATLKVSPFELLERLSELDTTRGKPEEELVIFTSIFRTKGLEYDYVVIPQCDENLLPYLKSGRADVFDTQGLVRESQMSQALENERRLFYVALTRARKGVLIGSSNHPSRFLEEIQLPSTESVMNAVQMLAHGDPNAEQVFLSAFQNRQANPVLVNNLVNGYLPDLGQNQLVADLVPATIPAVAN
jgi:DNA helicase II / ATP-dependent DNA helicase PcrA